MTREDIERAKALLFLIDDATEKRTHLPQEVTAFAEWLWQNRRRLIRTAEDALRYREATDELLELASSMASTAKCLAINSQFGAPASERAAIAAEMRLSEIRAALAPKEEPNAHS